MIRNLTAHAPHDWQDSAACATTDPDMFFADNERWNLTRQAVDFCRTCDVIEQCAEMAFREDIRHGVFGGLTALQRAAIRRKSA